MEGREKQRFEYYESEVWSIFANYLFGSEAAAVDAAMAELDPPLCTLNLSQQGLKKIARALGPDSQKVTELILDNNELQKWDNLDSYPALRKLSVSHNQLLRMYAVSRLHHLCQLDLSHNNILTIEGLKDLLHLRWLCLASNNIKTIEHLNTNVNLEHLDLSLNNIVHVGDMSYLQKLKQLLLHGNRITQLRQCERHLPPGLTLLTLSNNCIADLNEVSHLSHLVNLRDLSLAGNPCVAMTGGSVGFDYRPFVINWCMSLKVIDGFVVDAIESLKAEWLYSQGRGRQFRDGEQQALARYLASVCPLSGDSLESEEDRKLRLILSKAQQHQQQLREQLSISASDIGLGQARNRPLALNRSQSSPGQSPLVRRKSTSRSGTPRSTRKNGSYHSDDSSRLSDISSEIMISSYHMSSSNTDSEMSVSVGTLMTRSLDPSLLDGHEAVVDQENCPESASSAAPLQAATKLVPVPESLMSPDYRPATAPAPMPPKSPKARVPTRSGSLKEGRRHPVPRRGPSAPGHSSDEDSEMSASKLETIRHRAQERWHQKDGVPAFADKCEMWTNATPPSASEMPAPETVDPVLQDPIKEKAATCIQRLWRGYRTRHLDKRVREVFLNLRDGRTRHYLMKLTDDVRATREALEVERRLQLLQMQAIKGLWDKVEGLKPSIKEEATIPPPNDKTDSDAVRELTETCSRLNIQVELLQDSMKSLVAQMSALCQPAKDVAATQTDIVAVRTPQTDTLPFPYQRPHRPSSLPLQPSAPDAADSVQQFVTELVDDVLRTVAERGGETASSCASLPEDGACISPSILQQADV